MSPWTEPRPGPEPLGQGEEVLGALQRRGDQVFAAGGGHVRRLAQGGPADPCPAGEAAGQRGEEG